MICIGGFIAINGLLAIIMVEFVIELAGWVRRRGVGVFRDGGFLGPLLEDCGGEVTWI